MATDREIVQVIAERVMGWLRWENTQGDWDGPSGVTFYAYWDDDGSPFSYLDVYVDGAEDPTLFFNPLESWDAAGMVAEALQKRGVLMDLYANDGHSWTCSFDNGGDRETFSRVEGNTGPRAISLAAYYSAKLQQEAETKAVPR